MLRKAQIRHQLELVRLQRFRPNWVLGAETSMLFTPKAPYLWGFTTHKRLSPASRSQQSADTLKMTEKKNTVPPLSHTRASIRPERPLCGPSCSLHYLPPSRLITDTDSSLTHQVSPFPKSLRNGPVLGSCPLEPPNPVPTPPTPALFILFRFSSWLVSFVSLY